MNKLKFKNIWLAVVWGVFLFAHSVWAKFSKTSIDTFSKKTGTTGTTTDLARYTAGIIGKVLALVGFLIMGIIIYAGFKWLRAAGNEQAITEAKKMLIGGVIGLGIVFGAYVITSFVVANITG